jgi:hypothetical protein
MVAAVSRDVHAGAIVQEMVRLGLARIEGERLVYVSEDFERSGDFEDLMAVFAGNAADHLAAAVANVTAERPRFLEHCVFADELRPDSVDELHALARRLWRNAYRRSVAAITEKVAQDKTRGFADAPEMRMRFGVYFYAEPKVPTLAAPAGPPAAAIAAPSGAKDGTT